MNTKLVLGAVAAVALLGGAGYVMLGQPGSAAPAGMSALPEASSGAAPEVTLASSEAADVTEMALGAEDAPVTIIEYASFTCPHCATFHDTVFKQLKSEYIDTGKVRFIYREAYFDRFGLWASMVARCGGPERFFGITDLIYSGQSDWTQAGEPGMIADELRKIGRLAGLGADQVEACLTDGEKAQALVSWYEANQAEDNIRATPSFVINGELHSNMPFADFAEIIDAEIEG
jgi:protein-disulfide isomerase